MLSYVIPFYNIQRVAPNYSLSGLYPINLPKSKKIENVKKKRVEKTTLQILNKMNPDNFLNDQSTRECIPGLR